MTCKDCIHFGPCNRQFYDEIKPLDNVDFLCPHFKNKADLQEVRHGEWKVVYRNKVATVYECSICGHLDFGTSDYYICGAKMDRKDCMK